ncbi:MAG: hypothetical protein LBT29_00735 [Flavobacteriaceae bacterium]|nr:hypothetical protein [Flavobacteriaceae bacterium]
MNCKIFILFAGLWGVFACSQETWKNPNFRSRNLAISDTLVVLDSISVIPNTLMVKNADNQMINPNLYRFNSENQTLAFDKSMLNQNLKIEYYIYPEKKQTVIFSKDTSLIVNIRRPKNFYEITPETKKKTDFFQGLSSSGSMVRGITFGNNQSASVQSTLDLELSGQLSREVKIKAAISDHNIPIESEGYTQRLDEFDKIYIELSNKNSYLRAGHLDLIQNEDYFANFSRKITGVQLGTHIQRAHSSTDFYALGSLSRGEFNRMQFNGIEGNQGPYKLQGKQGELYIVVISGSEKVYLNGVLLTRDADRDYVINYNTGELTFTSNRYISSDSRIIVEYIYNTTTYHRFLLYAGAKHTSENFSFNANFFSEADSKNSNQDLTDSQKEILSQAGSDPNKMYAPHAVLTDYDANKILYRKTTFGNQMIYEYSTDNSDSLYVVSFTFVGSGKGNYRISQLPVNGRVYEYIPPLNNVLQGDYEPVVLLIAPQKTQILSANAEYKIKNGKIGASLAFSSHDDNTFSPVGNGGNSGFATRLFFDKQMDINSWKSNFHLEHTFIQKDFYVLERINNVEFSRDFNLNQEFNHRNQNKMRFDWNNQFGKKWTFNYTLNYLNEQDFYNGLKNDVFGQFKNDKVWISGKLSYLHTSDIEQTSDFIRHQTQAQQKIKNFTIGAGFEGESNQKKDKITDKYDYLSFARNEWYAFLGINDSAKINARLKLYTQTNDSVRDGKLQNFTHAYGAVLSSRLIKSETQNLSFEAHYRRVLYNKKMYENQEEENFVLGNIHWNKTFFNNGISLNAVYELASGQEAQREFKYVKVADGTGIYKWTDYNGNGIEEPDEFEVAEFSDQAQYIRVFTDNVKYVKSNKNRLNFSVLFSPSRFMKSAWWERISLQSAFQSASSYYKNNRTEEFNPFSGKDLLSRTQSFTTNFLFNRLNKNKWAANYQYINNNNAQYVYTGRETRNTDNHQFQFSIKPYKSWIFTLQNNFINDHSDSQLFNSKKFTIRTFGISPTVIYEFDKNISASAFFKYQDKKNLQGAEKLLWKQAGMDFRWNDNKKTSANGSFSFIQNDLTGNNYSLVSSQMMEGLQSGMNKVWKVYVQRELSSVFTLNLIYDGRKSEDTKTIHTGSVQLRATF